MTSDSHDPTVPAMPNLNYIKSIVAGNYHPGPFSNSRPTQVPYPILLCEDKLRRLKWQIPDLPADIMVLELEGNPNPPTWRPLFRQSMSSREEIEANHEITH